MLHTESEIYQKMSQFDPIFAALWYWTLVSLVFMVVLNMALGILVDASSAAKSSNQMSLAEQLAMTINVPYPWKSEEDEDLGDPEQAELCDHQESPQVIGCDCDELPSADLPREISDSKLSKNTLSTWPDDDLLPAEKSFAPPPHLSLMPTGVAVSSSPCAGT
eukprot:gnl/TRDRNA2_/TRDRNA2_146652_c1_seq1.p1 gnl/TRDRNA2_/TRDRNA2_146652_c1~~gnl/TRDRNA2_/TRDRNA2_146652_c1_seq1.p1  ORF type:complete len:163 (-),score=33.45 gnl/TRDRNA2_/TRDRNA2_146652_c1_seq1:403-891(-)